MIDKYTNFELNEANTQAKGLEIKNEYTKLINDPSVNMIDLGIVDDVSDTDITNIKQTYKNSQVKVMNGHYILIVSEGTIIKYTDFEKMNEDGFGNFNFFKKREPMVSKEANKILHSKTNGIASSLNIDGKEPTLYDQILYAYDTEGFESLSKEWKEIFIKMVDMANLLATDKE